MHRAIGRALLGVLGWRVEGRPPPESKVVFVAAPHTSYWDMPLMLAVAWSLGLCATWFGKHSIFRFPFGGFMRAIGGIPVVRDKNRDMVKLAVDRFQADARLFLVISPPGTRRRTGSWRSGFYQIARQARVPLCFGFLDFQRKVGGLGPTVVLTGDVRTDMDVVRAFYQAIMPKHPERKSVIRLELEDPPIEGDQVAKP